MIILGICIVFLGFSSASQSQLCQNATLHVVYDGTRNHFSLEYELNGKNYVKNFTSPPIRTFESLLKMLTHQEDNVYISKRFGSNDAVVVYHDVREVLVSDDVSDWNKSMCSRLLLKLKVASKDLKKPDEYGATALHWAALFGDVAAGEELVKKGVDVNAVGTEGTSPLYWAAMSGKVDFLKFLLDNGAQVDPDGSYARPLYIAAGLGRTDVVRLLVDKGADVNFMSPILEAARTSTATAEILLKKGADISTVDSDGANALHIAARSQRPETVALLIRAGIDVNSRDDQGVTPLMESAKSKTNDTIQVLKTLIKHGADVNAEDYYGRTALSSSPHEEIQTYLKSQGAKQRKVDEHITSS